MRKEAALDLLSKINSECHLQFLHLLSVSLSITLMKYYPACWQNSFWVLSIELFCIRGLSMHYH